MQLPDSRNDVAAATLVASPPIAACQTDQELDDWNTYYQLLLAGKLGQYAGEFIAVHRGNIIAQGHDPETLRRTVAHQFALPADRVVVPFVDDKECITVE